jgi:hypothetical protein
MPALSNERETRAPSGAIKAHPKGPAMFLSFLLSRLSRPARFVWTPALDLSDHEVYSALIPGTQY